MKPYPYTGKITQPETLEAGGRKYIRQTVKMVVSENPLITEGPFYVPVPSDGYMYLPDLAFCEGLTDQPGVMHRVGKS